MRISCFAALIFTAGTSVAWAEPNTLISVADRKFVENAASGGLAEVQMGKLAEKKGQSAEVRQFGRKMVKDHEQANEELKALAVKKGMSLPTSMTTEQQATYDRLAKLSGAEFDNAYMAAMKEDHDEDVAEFKRAATQGTDPDLRNWAGRTLPTLQQHDNMAHQFKQN